MDVGTFVVGVVLVLIAVGVAYSKVPSVKTAIDGFLVKVGAKKAPDA